MPIDKIIRKYEIMQITKQFTNNLKTILLVCSIAFTSLLFRQTLQIQHSCNPMIHWSGELPTECQIAVKTNNKNSSSQKKQIAIKTKSDNFNTSNSQVKQKTITPKQQPNTTQNNIKSQPNENTNISKTVESKTVAKISPSEPKNKPVSVGQLAKEHPIETTIAGASVVVGTALTVAALPLIGIPVAIAGVGVAIYSIFH